VTNLVRFHRTG